MPRFFLITGTSTGFGKQYAQEVLNQGDYVIATARDPTKLSFSNARDENYLAARLDVTDKASIESSFQAALKKFGRVDVVVNNAGYGLAGCFEEFTEEQIRRQMEVNFFGLVDVTRAAIETMRDRQSPQGGLIQQVTSIGGRIGFPFFSIYCASKWAVEGFTEAVSKEMRPQWGIKFTCVEPGSFQTEWSGGNMAFAERKSTYSHITTETAMPWTVKGSGWEAGDPAKAARAMYLLAVVDNPPLRVTVGKDAYSGLEGKLERDAQEHRKYESISTLFQIEGSGSS